MALFLSKRDVRRIVREELAPLAGALDALSQSQQTWFGILLTRLSTINIQLQTIMATQAELAAELAAKTTQIRKAIDEINTRLAALQEQINNAPVTPELRAAADALATAVQAADDIVPDAPPPPA